MYTRAISLPTTPCSSLKLRPSVSPALRTSVSQQRRRTPAPCRRCAIAPQAVSTSELHTLLGVGASVALLLPPAAYALVRGKGIRGSWEASGDTICEFNERVYFLDKMLRAPYYLVNTVPAMAGPAAWVPSYVTAMTMVVGPLRKWLVGLKGLEALGKTLDLSKGAGNCVQAAAYGCSCLVSMLVFWWASYSLPLPSQAAHAFKQVVAWTWIVGMAIGAWSAIGIVRKAFSNYRRFSRKEREEHPLFFRRNRREFFRGWMLLASIVADTGVALWMVGAAFVSKPAMGVCGALAAVFAIAGKIASNRNEFEKRLHGDIFDPVIIEPVVEMQVSVADVVAGAAGM